MKLARWGAALLLVNLMLTGCDLFGGAAPTPPPAGPSPTPGPSPTTAPASAAPTQPVSGSLGSANLQHLNFLVEDITIAGKPMAITHIYSEFPKYEWVDASGEGIAALDDAARAAVVYLTAYERRPDPAVLDKARRLLNFAMYLQTDDGEFYNFITDRQGTINQTGNTSYKSSGWWAARGLWAIGYGYRVFKTVDPTYAGELQRHFALGRDAWARQVTPLYTKTTPVHDVPVPGWLIAGGADVTAIAVLALLEVDRAENGQDSTTRSLLTQLADGLAQYQLGDGINYPWGMHPDSAAAPFSWHAWGSTQSFALARAGKQLGQAGWIASARKEADLFFSRFVAGPMVAEWGVLPLSYPQIAYGVNSITQAFLALYDATGDASYAQRAGLAAAWFFGNNAAQTPMYDPATGRGFDGLSGGNAQRINKNAGGESTIESLMAVLAVEAVPAAAQYLHFKEVKSTPWQVFEAEDGKQVAGDAATSYRAGDSTGDARWSNGHYVTMKAGDVISMSLSVPADGQYYLYSAYLKQQFFQQPFVAEALRVTTPPTIDGKLDEWQVAQPLSATQASNILRGTAGWGGADKDSFAGYLLWDDTNLYVAAHVFSPEHHQTETGPSVWKGDTLWIYLDSNHDKQSLESKLTLAQTPSGPQVWEWQSGFFLPDARLTWQQVPGGYIYEAALPWKSLNVRAPKVGQQMGINLGRGCCGSGFMDLSGTDPDIAKNEVQLTLVDTLSAGSKEQVQHPSGPDAVGLRWQLDDRGPGRQVQGGATDRDYLTLERLASAPFDLKAGDHSLRLEYAGTDPTRQISVDGVLLMPTVLHKTLRDDSGRQIDVTYAIDGGKWSATGP